MRSFHWLDILAMLVLPSSLQNKSNRSKLSNLFNLTVLSLVAFCFLAIVSAHSLSEDKVPANERESLAQVPPLQDETPHILVGSYYTLRNGFQSKLLLNNKGPQPLEVYPTLYNPAGQQLDLSPVTVAPNSFRFLNLQESAAVGGESFQSGSIKLFHTGKDLVLGAQIYITDEARSLSFEEKLAEISKFDSRRLESVWWMPSLRAEAQIVLSNTTNAPLPVTARLSKRPHHIGEAQVVQLAPHETRVFDLRRDFADGEPFAKSATLRSHSNTRARKARSWRGR